MTQLRAAPFEAGMHAKPDEFESRAVDEIVSRILKRNPMHRCDLHLSGNWSPKRGNIVYFHLYGEVSAPLLEDKTFEEEASYAVLDLFRKSRAPHAQLDAIVEVDLTPQSHELSTNGDAGDSGTPLVVAYADSPLNLPWERFLAVDVRDLFYQIMKNNGKVPSPYAGLSGVDYLEGLRGDGKVNFTALYDAGKFAGLSSVTIALEHDKELPVEELRDKCGRIIQSYLSSLESHNEFGHPKIVINGRGDWNVGGHIADSGHSEAKPHRHAFGADGTAEDSLSGEDPSKVSSTGSFGARELAVLAVRQLGVCKATVTLDYVIGQGGVIVNLTTLGGRSYDDGELTAWTKEQELLLPIPALIERYDLRNPKWRHLFAQNSDYFHSPEYPWNA